MLTAVSGAFKCIPKKFVLLKIYLCWWLLVWCVCLFGFFFFISTLFESPLGGCADMMEGTGDMKRISCFDRALWLAW